MTTSIPTSTGSGAAPISTSVDSGGSISGGAIAGIVIGAILGLAGTAFGIFKVWQITKNKLGGKKVSGRSQEPDYTAGEQFLRPVKSQQGAPPPFELLTTESAQELQQHEITDEGYRAEMQG